jgi:cobalt-zinc-cadmium efflux system protein
VDLCRPSHFRRARSVHPSAHLASSAGSGRSTPGSTPSDVNVTALRGAIGTLPGVCDVHDLHVWTLTSGMNAMSAHVVFVDASSYDGVLSAVHDLVTHDFKIGHVTVQIEKRGWRECEAHL